PEPLMPEDVAGPRPEAFVIVDDQQAPHDQPSSHPTVRHVFSADPEPDSGAGLDAWAPRRCLRCCNPSRKGRTTMTIRWEETMSTPTLPGPGQPGPRAGLGGRRSRPCASS